MMSVQQAWQMLQDAGIAQSRLNGDATMSIQRVHTDSRSLTAGDLFIALRGERFDAHDFLPQVYAQGGCAALVEMGRALPGLTCIEVPDSYAALTALASQWRQSFAIPVIGVTGSNGKTTVTQMVAAILQAAFGQNSLATQGNLNNEIGVPLMVLRLRASHRAAVFEMGMNHPGEIARLAQVAQPTVALVNNAQREHQEFMHTVEAVARENGAALQALPADGVAVFPSDDAFAPVWQSQAGATRVVHFSGQRDAAVHLLRAQWSGDAAAWNAEFSVGGAVVPLQIHMLGRHNLRNAMAAAAAAYAAGISHTAIAEGLGAFRPVKGRGVVHSILHDDGTRQLLIDDTYNANPDSVRAAIDVLAELTAPRCLILGDMGEVGDQGPQFHVEVGEYAKAKGIDVLWTLGEQAQHASAAFGAAAQHFGTMDALCEAVQKQAPYTASLLIKGSRFMAMERAVQHLLDLDGSVSGRVIT
ncbi:UDP-N-acetylmuramoyl-tripeptide--D-alanyl-D-alanine ligase [Lampropedia puyangensis]|uniref:UDP-N-acetylmuramoyl-tripeptide--D-alanyl-D-alanine ligase n=2 Tax=Lampropedia puyangensis TaxID=1330072 RepID=A0A4S8EP55_9BURK|nr:UDP-N-acetylmuramoyl-tripeptide--D-alanyl-D-alanine ligase [Lampropedia puyangensis]